MSDDDRDASAGGVVEAEGFRLRSLAIDPAKFRQFYDVIANETLWFLHHGLWDLPRRPRFDRHWWEAWAAYTEVNRQFAEAVADDVAPGATVLIQDYQLSLVGSELRLLRPDLRSIVFLHTPFCQPSELQVLPDRVADALLDGMAGAGACGFHSPRWADAFEACCRERRHRVPPTFVSAAAADTNDVERTVASPECQRQLERLDERIGDRQLIARVDRIELSKNLLRGFYAFDELLDGRPVHAGPGGLRRLRLPLPRKPGRLPRLPPGGRGGGQVHQRQVGDARVDADPARHRRQLRPLGRRPPALRRAARQPGARRPEPGRQGGPDRQRARRSPGPVAVRRRLGRAGRATPSRSIRSTSPARPTALLSGLTMASDERAARARALAKAASARTPHDWFADQLAAARIPGS